MDRPPPPQPPKPADTGHHLRAEPRDSMFLLAVVRRAGGGNDVTVKVRNLSPGGMMAECAGGFMRGDLVQVDLRGIGTVPGKVAWVAAGRIGLQFDHAIDHRAARVSTATTPVPTFLKVDVARSFRRPSVR